MVLLSSYLFVQLSRPGGCKFWLGLARGFLLQSLQALRGPESAMAPLSKSLQNPKRLQPNGLPTKGYSCAAVGLQKASQGPWPRGCEGRGACHGSKPENMRFLIPAQPDAFFASDPAAACGTGAPSPAGGLLAPERPRLRFGPCSAVRAHSI